MGIPPLVVATERVWQRVTDDASRFSVIAAAIRTDCRFRAGRARPSAAQNDATASREPAHRTGDLCVEDYEHKVPFHVRGRASLRDVRTAA